MNLTKWGFPIMGSFDHTTATFTFTFNYNAAYKSACEVRILLTLLYRAYGISNPVLSCSWILEGEWTFKE